MLFWLLSWLPFGSVKKNLKNGDRIYYTVLPSDGKIFGTLATSPVLVLGNILPVISNLEIVSLINGAIVFNPTSSVSLLAQYVYYDSLGRAEEGTIFEWFLNDVLIYYETNGQPQLVDNPAKTNTNEIIIVRGNKLKVKVTPANSLVKGNPYESTEVVIQNTAPVVSDVVLSPIQPTKFSVLTLSYTYYDKDGDADLSEIYWYKNNVLIGELNGRKSISSSLLVAGDTWYAVVNPFDGIDYGISAKTLTVKIQWGKNEKKNNMEFRR